MRRLRSSADGERGAVAIMVALLLPLIFIGMAALTVDVGNISAERRQLQNGADAVALSAALDCARNATCPTVAAVDPQGLANGNAADGATKIARVDGEAAVCGKGTGLADCPAVSSGLGDCVETSGPLPGQYVRVYTQTESKSGSTVLPYFFAQAIVGDGSTGTTQQACATAAWGTPGKLTTTIPFIVGMCEWGKDTNHGSTFPGHEVAIELNQKGDTCATWNDHNYPGGFGWLGAVNCKAEVAVGDWVGGSPGEGKGAGECASMIEAAVGTTIYFPVFDCFSMLKNSGPCDFQAQGQKTMYHVIGLAAFYLSGVDVSGVKGTRVSPSPVCAAGPVAAGSKAFYGCFVKAIVPVGSIDTSGGSPDLGLNVIQMVG